jgi:pimeloyl-ACP methyl ester carboxylesterase
MTASVDTATHSDQNVGAGIDSVWLRMLGGQSRYYQGKYRTRVLEAGQGEPLILIHGVGGHAETWVRNVVPLSKQFRVLALDLLWHGFSEKPTFEGDTIPRFVEQVLDLMDAAGIESAHIEGESLGGWVAVWLALQHPERVRRLVLNTTAGLKVAGERAAPAPGLAERSMAAIRNPDRETIRKRMEWLVADPSRMPAEMVEIRYRIYNDPETNKALEQLFHAHLVEPDIHAKYDFDESDLGRITVPTLVMWTEHNPGMGPDVGKHIADAIPSAEFVVMGDCGHWPQFENSEEHDALLTKFLLCR